MKYQYCAPFRALIEDKGLSERRLCELSGLSRSAIRGLLSGSERLNMSSVIRLSEHFDSRVTLLISGESGLSECSILASCFKIERDGFRSWKIHLMDFVDEFRRTLDPQLILLSVPSFVSLKLKALLASTVSSLCEEIKMSSPDWARRRYFLETPWFVSEMNSLVASALIESPLQFRRNNIFVLDNFLERA